MDFGSSRRIQRGSGRGRGIGNLEGQLPVYPVYTTWAKKVNAPSYQKLKTASSTKGKKTHSAKNTQSPAKKGKRGIEEVEDASPEQPLPKKPSPKQASIPWTQERIQAAIYQRQQMKEDADAKKSKK